MAFFIQKNITKRGVAVNTSFKRGASEAAEGCLASVAAKLVKTAIKISFYIHARENKSSAANLGHFGAFSYAFKNLL